MESLLVLLGLIALAMPIAIVALIVGHVRLRRDLRTLRAEVATLRPGTGPAVSTAPAQTADVARPTQPAGSPSGDTAAQRPAQAAGHPADPTIGRPAQRPDAAPQSADTAARPPSGASTPWHNRPMQGPHLPPTPSLAARLAVWLRENWFYAAAAVSLALAGLFLVQYGVESGLLTPPARVAAALALGAALIGGGEYIRRRFGDGEASSTAYLPSVLSGAGLVSLMGAVLSARLLYDLIEPGPALAALFAVALLGLTLGWRHGPLLAAVGLIGGMAAPFLVGGQSDQPAWLLGYFGLLTALGLGIDTLRRWAWISALSLVLGYAAGFLLSLGTGRDETLAACLALYASVLALLAILIPCRALTPDHAGPTVTETVLSGGSAGRAIFPAWLSLGAVAATAALLMFTALTSTQVWWIALALASGLAALLAVWSRPAPALQDHAALPVLALLMLLGAPELAKAPLLDLAAQLAAQEGQTETRMPLTFTLALLAALVPALAAAWRSLQGGRFALVWAAAATALPPLAGLILDIGWGAPFLVGLWPWALHALAMAGVMTALALRFARASEDRARPALAALSALGCIAYALTLLLTASALTLALAVTVVVAAALDRCFNLPLMGGYIAAGVIALGYRLTVDPGLAWARIAPFAEMLASYGGTLALLLLARHLLLPMPRPRARLFLESAAWSVGGMTLSLVIFRIIDARVGHYDAETAHWALGLYGTVWIGVALAQLERLTGGSGLIGYVRVALSATFGFMAAGLVLLAVTLANPLFSGETVHGPILLNTLAPAYLLPALVLAAGALRLRHLHRALRLALGGVALALALLWVGMAIRHVWQGGAAMEIAAGITQPELYAYTVALLLMGAGLFYQALARRSDLLRRAGVGVIALAVAKVFLIDISGLDGLARVFSFLLLGLSLAGLAWLNRWVQARRTA